MIINAKQIGALRKDALNQYIIMAFEYLEEEYPEKISLFEKSFWLNWIRLKIEEAKKFDILNEDVVLIYIDLAFNYPEFEQSTKPKWALHFLTWPSMEAERKLELIQEYLLKTTNN